MDLKLQGMTALVTGASKGIGLATLRAFIAEGMSVVTASRTITPELVSTGAHSISADLSTRDAPARVVSEALARLGTLDVLVNNVGGGDAGAPGPGFLDADEDLWQHTFDLNFFAAVRTTRAALPALLDARGTIVNLSSDAARRPHGGPLPYSAAKAALNAFSKGLSEEVGPLGVRVNTVSPSSTRTALWEGEQSFGADLAVSMGITQKQLIETLPAHEGMLTERFIEPEEIANVITYLASPLATSVHGANWVVDAGVSKMI